MSNSAASVNKRNHSIVPYEGIFKSALYTEVVITQLISLQFFFSDFITELSFVLLNKIESVIMFVIFIDLETN